jgi:hypothetical protein
MSSPLSRYLQDFGKVEPPPMPPALPSPIQEDFGSSFDFEPAPEVVTVDLAAERATAFAEGQEAGRADAIALWEAQRAEIEARHAEELTALKMTVEAEAAQRIDAQLTTAVTSLARHLSDQMALVLAPLVQEALMAKALEETSRMISEALTSEEVTVVTIHGPLKLFEKIKALLTDVAKQLKHVEADDLDITVDVDEAALVTRMSAWAASLQKVLG